MTNPLIAEIADLPQVSATLSERALHGVRQAISDRINQFMPLVGKSREYANECLLWSVLGKQTLIELGIPAQLLAGSASWPLRTEAEAQDPDVLTHFSYVWSPDEALSVTARMLGIPPEIHAWLCVPPIPWSVVDFSTGDLHASANRCGLQFSPGSWQPPECLLEVDFDCSSQQRPEILPIRYRPEPDALRWLLSFAGECYRQQDRGGLPRPSTADAIELHARWIGPNRERVISETLAAVEARFAG